jgi:hypothetical protein
VIAARVDGPAVGRQARRLDRPRCRARRRGAPRPVRRSSDQEGARPAGPDPQQRTVRGRGTSEQRDQPAAGEHPPPAAPGSTSSACDSSPRSPSPAAGRPPSIRAGARGQTWRWRPGAGREVEVGAVRSHQPHLRAGGARAPRPGTRAMPVGRPAHRQRPGRAGPRRASAEPPRARDPDRAAPRCDRRRRRP